MRAGKTWLDEVRFLVFGILDGKLKDLTSMPGLISACDFFYRVCIGGPCYGYLRKVKLKTVDRWLKGEKANFKTEVAQLFLSVTGWDIRTLEKHHSDFAFSVLGEWIDELARYEKIP